MSHSKQIAISNGKKDRKRNKMLKSKETYVLHSWTRTEAVIATTRVGFNVVGVVLNFGVDFSPTRGRPM